MIYDAKKGHRGRVIVDGHEVQHVIRCKPGINGWIEVSVRDKKGLAKINARGTAIKRRFIRCNHVDFIRRKY